MKLNWGVLFVGKDYKIEKINDLAKQPIHWFVGF